MDRVSTQIQRIWRRRGRVGTGWENLDGKGIVVDVYGCLCLTGLFVYGDCGGGRDEVIPAINKEGLADSCQEDTLVT